MKNDNVITTGGGNTNKWCTAMDLRVKFLGNTEVYMYTILDVHVFINTDHTFIGLTNQSDLKWQIHINIICFKAKPSLSFIKRFALMPSSTL